MIDLQYIKSFYPNAIADNPAFGRHLLKEYIELMVLDFLSNQTSYLYKICFIGGTNLRLVKGINRFSEDLDFDCKDLTKDDFNKMTDAVVSFLKNSGLNAEVRDKDNQRLTAFRRSIYFPQLLFDLSLTGHRDERFLLKIEAQDQGIEYDFTTAMIDKCGFHIPVTVPPDDVLLSMKISALLTRAKGRDFYDIMFLMQKTHPSYAFLESRNGIHDSAELLDAINKKLDETNLEIKVNDFKHLLLNPYDASRILDFRDFINEKLKN